jgi:hypothetical protein
MIKYISNHPFHKEAWQYIYDDVHNDIIDNGLIVAYTSLYDGSLHIEWKYKDILTDKLLNVYKRKSKLKNIIKD